MDAVSVIDFASAAVKFGLVDAVCDTTVSFLVKVMVKLRGTVCYQFSKAIVMDFSLIEIPSYDDLYDGTCKL